VPRRGQRVFLTFSPTADNTFVSCSERASNGPQLNAAVELTEVNAVGKKTPSANASTRV